MHLAISSLSGDPEAMTLEYQTESVSLEGAQLASSHIAALFIDIGNVLLTNGWDRDARQRACQTFNLDYDEVNERHHLTFPVYEEGKISLDEYLGRTVFYEERAFSQEKFISFMFAQSEPCTDMIQLIRALKARYSLKIVAISNEGQELTIYRIEKFGLREFVDFFVSSCFVHCRKPDHDIYRFALDGAQVPLAQVVYIDDRPMFANVAADLGIRSIHHTSYESTRADLEAVGLSLEESSISLHQGDD